MRNRLAARVHNAKFRKARLGRRGYSMSQVDSFLDAIERELVSPGRPDLRPADLSSAVFDKERFGRRGYDEGDVRNFLHAVELELVDILIEGGWV